MIKKLNLEEVNNPGEATLKAFSILNQLVDAVNKLNKEAKNNARIRADHEHKIEELQDNQNTYWTDIGEIKAKIAKGFENLKAPADPYAEQRKWIGKVCKFWDNLDTNYSLALLVKIIEKELMPFEDYLGNKWYHCEPVKPDDDIIYKGGENE